MMISAVLLFATLFLCFQSPADACCDVVTALTTKVDASRRHVSFLAQRKDNTFTLPSAPVIFDKAIHNFGNGYNAINGIFTAPFTGFYLFIVQIFVSEKQANRVIVDLVKNNEPISRMAFYSQVDSGTSDSTSVVVSLVAGDKVQVLGRENAGQSCWGSYHTFFSGSLLYSP